MSVAENVAYQLREDRMSEEEVERRVQEVLHFVELEQTVDMLPSELSGGMRRRVSIARALATRPPVVLYDSPTAGLDPVTAQTIITLILRSRDLFGVTAMLATQRLQDGFALANFRFDPESKRVVRLTERESTMPARGGNGEPATRFVLYREGRVYFEGAPEELAESKDAYLQRFLV
jgi:phospholipid/cholesterol/gamma-HCH transport system ATP-binding protein